ncbi:hypothetical protein QTP86_004481 [Hemibagrus guttatus]|nr:hypothetical protein QTP86_004481 [Hemibagrus guttatus]
MAWAKFFRKPGSNLGRVYQPGSMLSLAPTKGLLNEPGQNSCFLNSAVQVLWQLDIFRRSLRQVPNHNCLGEACIFCALKRESCENILQRIHQHIVNDDDTDACTSKFCITHQKFAMTLYEQSKCGQVIKIRRVLMNSPEIVTIGFVWDSEQSDETENVIRSLSPHLSLSGVFYHVTDEQAQKSDLQLVGMICYTSKHYCTFAFHTKSSKWFFFDDATVKEVGSKWKDVVTKCIRGHFQPLLLFYSDPEGSAVRGAEVPRSDSSASHNKPSANCEIPVKMSSDPKGFLRELSREVAREARNINIMKRDNDKSHQRPETPSQRDTASERSYSRSLSPPENGFKNTESRLYRSQGRGPTRAERSPRTNRRVAHAPRSHSQPRIPVQPPSSNLSSRSDFSNGYDTDSSYDSRERPNGASRTHTNRGWKPMREVLNVDSILSSDNEQHPPSLSHQTSGQRRLPYERESRTAREDGKPKSLMTIYEDEQRHELGSRSSLESESRESERTKGTVNHFTQKKENWKNQRMESGYERSDWLSNGSASLDSPLVDNVGAKELRRVPDLHLLRDPDYQRRHEDSKADGSQTPFSFGELRGKTHEYNPRLNRRGHMDRTDGVHGSSGIALFSKTSSSDWNSSDDLAGPVSEQEDSLSQTDVPPLVHHQPAQSLSQSSPPPLPPKPQALRSENRRGQIQDSTQTRPKSPAYRGGTLSRMSSEIWLENSEPNMLSSSDSSSKSGSSDQERNDLSASESEDKCPSNLDCYVEPTVTGEYAIPTTYFSVDSCMTDTYRAKYHKKRSALHAAANPKTGEHTSSSESDHGDRASPSPAGLKIPDLSRTKKETAHASSKPIVKWNPVSVKGLDEHGFL